MNAQEQIAEIVKVIQSRVDSFNESIPDVEKKVYSRLLQLLKELKTINGRVANGVENLNKISAILPEIEELLNKAGLEKKAVEFSQAFDEVAKLQNNYFSALTVQFTPKKVLTKLLDANKKWTVEKLTARGINAGFAPAMQDILTRAMTTGAEYSELAEQVRSYVISGEAGPGALARYSRQVSTDALNFFSANYNETITQDLGLKWRIYTGTLLETSREWCVHMVEKKYVHEAELQDCLTKEIDGVEIGGEEIPINKKTGLPRGLREGTTAESVKVDRGGWLCGHQWASVTESMVPLNIRIATYDKYGIGHTNGIANGTKKKAVEVPLNKLQQGDESDQLGDLKDPGGLPDPKITPQQKEALQNYSLSDYGVLNARMMGISGTKLTKENKTNVDLINEAANNNPLEQDIVVNRFVGTIEGASVGIGGFSFDQLKNKIGETITHKGFLSTTLADNLFWGADARMIRIKVPKGTPSVYLEGFTKNQGEFELLIGSGQQIKIEGIENVDGQDIIIASIIAKQQNTAPKPAPAPKPAATQKPNVRYELQNGITIEELRNDIRSVWEDVYDELDQKQVDFINGLTESNLHLLDAETFEFLSHAGIFRIVSTNKEKAPKKATTKKTTDNPTQLKPTTTGEKSKYANELYDLINRTDGKLKSDPIYKKSILPILEEMQKRAQEEVFKVGTRTIEPTIKRTGNDDFPFEVEFEIYGITDSRAYNNASESLRNMIDGSEILRPENIVALTGFDPKDIENGVFIKHILGSDGSFKTKIEILEDPEDKEYDFGIVLDREIDWTKKVIKNNLFKIKEGSKWKGKGSLIFENQVKQARMFGFEKIETSGAKGYKFNGYYTWPRLGYDSYLKQSTIDQINKKLGIKVESLKELFMTQEGRDFWKEYGYYIDLEFDLQDTEDSITRLLTYMNDKKK